eukprot:783637-Rhodomonas_salina.5
MYVPSETDQNRTLMRPRMHLAPRLTWKLGDLVVAHGEHLEDSSTLRSSSTRQKQHQIPYVSTGTCSGSTSICRMSVPGTAYVDSETAYLGTPGCLGAACRMSVPDSA